MKLEIGGGIRNRKEDWINLDICPTANIVHNLDYAPWPVENDFADMIYSSHCIEHVKDPKMFLRECARIGKLGSTVEIRCPDSASEMAMVVGHIGVVSINFMRHADHIFPEMYWENSPKKLALQRIEAGADDFWFNMARANPLFKDWPDGDILTWLPRTRHENEFHFIVVDNK
jgi:SAM-dependent methyltransferase